MHEAESLSVITHGLFLQMLIHWYSDIYYRWFWEKHLWAFIQISQEGRIMKTLIGVIHSSVKHNTQLCFHIGVRPQSSAAATVHSCFSLPVRFRKLSWGYEDVPVVQSHGTVKLGPLFLGSMPPHKPMPEELCHALLSSVRRQGTQGIIHSIW